MVTTRDQSGGDELTMYAMLRPVLHVGITTTIAFVSFGLYFHDTHLWRFLAFALPALYCVLALAPLEYKWRLKHGGKDQDLPRRDQEEPPIVTNLDGKP